MHASSDGALPHINVNLLTVNCHYFRTRMTRIEQINCVLLQIIMIAPYIVDSCHLLEEDKDRGTGYCLTTKAGGLLTSSSSFSLGKAHASMALLSLMRRFVRRFLAAGQSSLF